MAFIPNLRVAPNVFAFGTPLARQLLVPGKVQDIIPQGYVDTPDIIYSEWLTAAGGIYVPLGTLPSSLKVAVIGAGIAGLTAAFELSKAGATVHIYEASNQVGGRLRSDQADELNFAEMGAMRFPPSSDLLYTYAKNLGFSFIQNFPNPGEVPTVISYKDKTQLWTNSDQPPAGFETVYDGWNVFVNEGIRRGGVEVFLSSYKMQVQYLQSTDPNIRKKVIPHWQQYLDTFANDTFYSGLRRIFGPGHEWDIPGGVEWTTEDFKKFGALGIGSGGFGPLFNISFNSVYALMPNGLETLQATFAKPSLVTQPSGWVAAPIQDLAKAMQAKATEAGATINLHTKARVTSATRAPQNSLPTVSVEAVDTNTGIELPPAVYNIVLGAATTRALNIGISLTSRDILPINVSSAINSIHMTDASKLFIMTDKFWQDPNYPRAIISDTKVPQLYTLEYGNGKKAMVLITYAWEDQSTQLATLDDAQLRVVLTEQIGTIMKKAGYPEFVEKLINPNDPRFVAHWQREPYMFGGWCFPQPGQAPDVETAFYDFERVREPTYNGFSLIGDSVSFNGGWSESALQTSLNVVSMILKRFGTIVAEEKAPCYLIKRNYDYTGAKPK